jgi:hypothetical protein
MSRHPASPSKMGGAREGARWCVGARSRATWRIGCRRRAIDARVAHGLHTSPSMSEEQSTKQSESQRQKSATKERDHKSTPRREAPSDDDNPLICRGVD